MRQSAETAEAIIRESEVVDNSLKYLSKEDAEALVSYLAEVPAISNVIKSKEKKRRAD